MRLPWLWFLPLAFTAGCVSSTQPVASLAGAEPGKATVMETKTAAAPVAASSGEKVVKSEQEWKKELTPEQYRILREKGTERAFTGKYWNHKGDGAYACAGCGAELFTSDTKFDSGCGWPSFWDAVGEDKIEKRDDYSFGMHRVEVLCRRCGGHLGHLFDDGPNPTGQRYCINSASIDFKDKKEKAEHR